MKSHATHSNIRRTVLRCALILGVLAMLTTLLVIGTMQARYVEQAEGASTLVTPAFYFRSDLLSTGGESHTLNAGTTQLSVRLFNYADALRVAQTPITYTYELKETSTGTIKKTGNDTLGSGTPIAAAEAILTLDGLSAGQYELEVKSTAPYTTTLRGTFVIKSADINLYYHGEYLDTTEKVIATLGKNYTPADDEEYDSFEFEDDKLHIEVTLRNGEFNSIEVAAK
jgi:hypothetical protein